jgi:hypothetical protein
VAGFGKGFLPSAAIRASARQKIFAIAPGIAAGRQLLAISRAAGASTGDKESTIARKTTGHRRVSYGERLAWSRPQRGFALSLGSFTGTCGEELTTRGLPSAAWAWLRSISSTNMNFSASIGIVHF